MFSRVRAFALVVLLLPAAVAAGPITSLYVIGDSLSDQGNGFILTNGTFPPPPYAQRASNGPVAVERLASALGLPLLPSAAGGTNYAVLGATTGAVPIPGSNPPATTENIAGRNYGQPALAGTSLLSQVFAVLQTPIADPFGALFVVWGGANDLSLNPSLSGATTAVSNLTTAISALYGAGGRQFLVPNLPRPVADSSGVALPPLQRAGLQALTVGFNNGLATAVAGLSALPGIDITLFDTFAVFNTLLSDPGAYGFTNATAPCLTGTVFIGATVCSDPSACVFWDALHPTTAVHQVLGNAFAAAVVPEPAMLMLISVGVGLAAARQRRARS